MIKPYLHLTWQWMDSSFGVEDFANKKSSKTAMLVIVNLSFLLQKLFGSESNAAVVKSDQNRQREMIMARMRREAGLPPTENPKKS